MTYPWETVEVGVRVRTALRAVDYIEVSQREVESLGEGFNPRSQQSTLQRGQLVEQRLNDGWVENDHAKLEYDTDICIS